LRRCEKSAWRDEGGAMISRQEEFRTRLLALGFDDVRFTSVTRVPEAPLRDWLAAGMHGEMHWMERTAAKRWDPELVLPGARSIIVLGVNYWPGPEDAASTSRPQWARYARYADYHDTISPALEKAGLVLEEFYGGAKSDYLY
jgi:epoxyqueuosine reductase